MNERSENAQGALLQIESLSRILLAAAVGNENQEAAFEVMAEPAELEKIVEQLEQLNSMINNEVWNIAARKQQRS